MGQVGLPEITFEDFETVTRLGVSEASVRDIVTMFYDGPPGTRFIIRDEAKTRRKGIRGEHTMSLGTHVITLFSGNIVAGFRSESGTVGGGNVRCHDLRSAIVSVLLHEIRHASQRERYVPGTRFWKGAYRRRACEVDARRFADESLAEAEEMLDIPEDRRTRPERGTDRPWSSSRSGTGIDPFLIAMELISEGITDIVAVRDFLDAVGSVNPVDVRAVLDTIEEIRKTEEP